MRKKGHWSRKIDVLPATEVSGSYCIEWNIRPWKCSLGLMREVGTRVTINIQRALTLVECFISDLGPWELGTIVSPSYR